MPKPEKTNVAAGIPPRRERLDWIDQLKGFTIFLVVYGHNFPFCEKYIYSFHMPLFILTAGFFHPQISSYLQLKKRFVSLIVPYFIWSFFLFAIWYFVTRNYGDSAALNLSPAKNFLGVFMAQGDRAHMDWGIPMWFLPALFITFLLMSGVLKINKKFRFFALCVLVALGLAYPHFTSVNLPWSINIAMAALFFYAIGFYGFGWIAQLPRKHAIVIMIVSGLLSLVLFDLNIKIDMYRAIYGTETLFLLNGITGCLFVLCFFKAFPAFKFLGFIGKFSLTILALQLLAMTFIKFVIMIVRHKTEFDFSEAERFLYAIIQVILLVPAFYLINKYAPFLNGGYKKI